MTKKAAAGGRVWRAAEREPRMIFTNEGSLLAIVQAVEDPAARIAMRAIVAALNKHNLELAPGDVEALDGRAGIELDAI